MTRYFYKLTYGWYDESTDKEFWSEVKYSREQFDDLLRELVKQAVEDLIERHDTWIGASTIAKRVSQLLLTKEFFKLEYDAEHHMVGTGIYRADYGKDDGWFDRMMDKELRDLIIEYNIAFEERLTRDFASRRKNKR